ncbi:MAG TPA: oligosaccharide flippase family protein [Candidatus Binatia bacterium]|nr:oligosaccharide flippase family protein [Candidatus Binatia bacterium]
MTSGLGRNAALALAGAGLEKLVPLGIALYLPRHLGVAGFGEYALVVAMLGFFQVLPDASLEAVLVARLARAEGEARAIAGRAAALRLLVAAGGALLGLAALALVTRDGRLVGAGGVAALGLAAGAGNPYRALLRARLRLGRYVGLVAGQAALAVALLAAVVRAGGGLAAVFGAVSAAAAGGVVLGRLLVGRGAALRRDPALDRRLAADAWPLAANTLALLAAQQVLLQVLLVRWHGAAAVGLLAGAQRLVDAIGQLPQALMVSVLPALSAAASTPNGAVVPARDVARVLVVAVVPAVAALAVWAQPLLTLVFGTAEWRAAVPLVRVLVPGAVLVATGTVLSNLLVALGLQRALLRVNVGAALVMVALGLALVPGEGARGAAIATLAAMLAGQAALAALPPTRAVVAPVLAGVIAPLAAGGAAAAVALAATRSPVLGVTTLVVGYPAVLFATRTITRTDLARWVG